MRFVPCTYAAHAGAILAIFNEAITTSTALYDYHPRTLENMVAWFKAKEAGQFPVIGVVDEAGQLLGFASYGSFRAFAAYQHTAEHSVYVHKDHRGLGLGLALMRRLIETASARQVHTLVGVVDTANAASLGLHEKLGFTRAGTLKEVGFKFGRWLDVEFWQLMLGPIDPAP